MKNSYKLLILGDHYSVVSDESQAQLTAAASLVDTLMKEIAGRVSHMDEKRVAVLVALQMASKMLALESQIEHTAIRHKELIDRLDQEYLTLRRP
jgi:cell division protein ZapA (FtsZ GTPase activity inhibitor)